MDTNTLQKLKEARQYMEQHDYRRAKAILKNLNSPVAKKWLAQMENQEVTQDGNLSTSKIKRKEINEHSQKTPEYVSTGTPWNPYALIWATFFTGFLLTGIVISIFLSWNWRRLGRPHWALESFLITLGLPVITLALIVALGAANGRGLFYIGTILFIVIAALFGANVVMGYGVMVLQNGAYKKWEMGSSQAMLEHEYPFDKLIIAMIIGAVISVGIGLYWGSESFLPKTYTDGTISFTYPGFWEYSECEAGSSQYCVFTLSLESESQVSGFGFIRYPAGMYPSGSVLEEAIRAEFMSDKPEIQLLQIQDIMLDGIPVRIRESREGYDACANRYRQLFMVHRNIPYRINFTSSCEQTWEQHQNHINFIMNSIQFE